MNFFNKIYRLTVEKNIYVKNKRAKVGKMSIKHSQQNRFFLIGL
mgnify:CR=1 FL=1